MLGRKGVLISDPSVAEMTDAQWIFELKSLQAIEEEKTLLFKSVQRMLISLLGLDLVKQAGEKESGFIPLSMICGNPHALKAIEEMNEREEKAAESLEDDDFDAWSEQMAAGDLDDLIPAEDEPLVDFTTKSPTLTFD